MWSPSAATGRHIRVALASLSIRLATLLGSTTLSAPVAAQEASVQFNEIFVEAQGQGAPVAVTGSGTGGRSGDGSATGGGCGGPTGITGYLARISATATETNTPLIDLHRAS